MTDTCIHGYPLGEHCYIEPKKYYNPALPYNETEGSSGSDASRDRAEREVSTGSASRRQQMIHDYLDARGQFGATWAEVDRDLDIKHHGATTGSLSAMHKEHRIARLAHGKRKNCSIYVLPEYVNGRETREQGRRG